VAGQGAGIGPGAAIWLVRYPAFVAPKNHVPAGDSDFVCAGKGGAVHQLDWLLKSSLNN
jgi:hypothetical protein